MGLVAGTAARYVVKSRQIMVPPSHVVGDFRELLAKGALQTHVHGGG